MRNIYILIVLLAIQVSVFGQTRKTENKLNKTINTSLNHDENYSEKRIIKPNVVKLKKGKSNSLARHEIGKSGNAYSFLASYQRCLFYDKSSNTLLATHRADPESYPDALSSGTIMAHYSINGGETWTHKMAINPDPDVHSLRYPSGIIFNPDNSNNIEDVYSVVAGPSHVGGLWDYTFFASTKYDNSNFSEYYHPWSEIDGNDWARSSMSVVPGAVYLFGRDYETTGADLGLNQTMKHYVGTTDDPAEGFEWEVYEVTPDWLIDPAGGNSVALYTTFGAFSKDGSIGYMWMIGATNESQDYGGYQPIVYYTDNGGDDWEEIELDMEDHPTLIEYLPPWEDINGNPGTVKPTMGIATNGDRNFPGVVDYQGRLHLFANIYGSSTESVIDPEGGYWIVGDNSGGHIFDIILDENGLSDIIFIDSIVTERSNANAFGEVDWDHRLQASKSLDEKVVFAVWADDRGSEDGTLLNPDIYAWAYNSETGVKSEAVNFTQDDLYAGFYFYHFVAELTPIVDGIYNIPVSTSVTPAEFGGNDDLQPVTHNFVEGIGFQQDELVGVSETNLSSADNIIMHQNEPNPYSFYTRISIKTTVVSSGIFEVIDITGQTVFKEEIGRFTGEKEIIFNRSNLSSGVYFYRFSTDTKTLTKKMLIE